MPEPGLTKVVDAIGRLYGVYTPEGVGVWLQGRKKTLDCWSPLGLLEAGYVDEFVAAVNRLEEGMGA
jgi:hypothetical protein